MCRIFYGLTPSTVLALNIKMFTVTQVSSEIGVIVAPNASLCYDKVSSRPLNVPLTYSYKIINACGTINE